MKPPLVIVRGHILSKATRDYWGNDASMSREWMVAISTFYIIGRHAVRFTLFFFLMVHGKLAGFKLLNTRSNASVVVSIDCW